MSDYKPVFSLASNHEEDRKLWVYSLSRFKHPLPWSMASLPEPIDGGTHFAGWSCCSLPPASHCSSRTATVAAGQNVSVTTLLHEIQPPLHTWRLFRALHRIHLHRDERVQGVRLHIVLLLHLPSIIRMMQAYESLLSLPFQPHFFTVDSAATPGRVTR